MIAVLYFALLIHQYRMHALLLHPSTNTSEILIFPRFHKGAAGPKWERLKFKIYSWKALSQIFVER